jgi:hypothetical protein
VQPGAVPDLSAGPDARVASDADTVAEDCTRAHVDGVTDDGVVTDVRPPVDPAAGADAASGADLRARFYIRAGPDD